MLLAGLKTVLSFSTEKWRDDFTTQNESLLPLQSYALYWTITTSVWHWFLWERAHTFGWVLVPSSRVLESASYIEDGLPLPALERSLPPVENVTTVTGARSFSSPRELFMEEELSPLVLVYLLRLRPLNLYLSQPLYCYSLLLHCHKFDIFGFFG